MAAPLETCLALLEDVTPLRGDCGRLCGAACCRSLEGEETGMLLFPGEAPRYAGRPGWRVIPCAAGELLICPGRCSRDERPLACRLFPVLPVPRGDAVRVRFDLRAAAVCPLTREGLRALDPAFVEAVRACGRVLLGDPELSAALERLLLAQEDLAALRREMGG